MGQRQGPALPDGQAMVPAMHVAQDQPVALARPTCLASILMEAIPTPATPLQSSISATTATATATVVSTAGRCVAMRARVRRASRHGNR
jgi:hypothetical protein